MDEDIVVKQGDGLEEDGVIMVEGGANDSLIEDGVSQDVYKEDLLFSDGEMEEVDWDFVGGGVQDQGHD